MATRNSTQNPKRNPKVDAFVDRAEVWKDETIELRRISLACGLTEELKWGKPAYTSGDGSLIGIIQGFKKYCALLFPKGALLEDPLDLLVKVGPNTRSGRQARFTSVAEILEVESALKAYLQEAVDVEEAGLEVDMEAADEVVAPEELEEKFGEDPEFKKAFHALTPGRQREYLLHFSGAKQSKTRTSRVEKAMDRILDGKGLRDR
ncbi:MAG: YdeI/OmpD-associated family protein [Acidimicrobiia bacterium]|nr:YdeI/OmpD-associated family protein [Acidimicrobiia bacterium]MDH5520353.1 YdeI/OmpD-associated family protein [Acidimicrobiia bacterium]